MSTRNADLLGALQGKRLLVLNWRDIRHPQAGGAEQYMHEVSCRWVKAGIDVTWFTGRGENQSQKETIDGINILRSGGPLSVYPWTALRMLGRGETFAAVVDCQNGIPFFSPLFIHRRTAIVQLVHHVHQQQFQTRFAPPMALVGKFLERSVAKAVYSKRAIAAVSPSTRLELRRLGYDCPIFVVPNGSIDLPLDLGPRDPDPTITVVSRLVPHKRIDLLLAEVAVAVRSFPLLRIEIVGDGPERHRLQDIAVDLGLQSRVRFHGYQPDDVRDSLLRRAWLTVSTSAAEGWGCSIIEAAAWGVPCLALRVPGIRDSVVEERTGWLVDSPREFSAALIAALKKLSDEAFALKLSLACQEWAGRFTWDRSASLLAGVLLNEMQTGGSRQSVSARRDIRSDISTLVRFEKYPGLDLGTQLRPTDEVAEYGNAATVILNGCDEFGAETVMNNMGISNAIFTPVGRTDLLAGPSGFPIVGDGSDVAPGSGL